MLSRVWNLVKPLNAAGSMQWHRLYAVVVDVRDDNIDQALGRLQRKMKDNGIVEEFAKRQYRLPSSTIKFQAAQKAFNKRMGQKIYKRLQLVSRRY